MLTLIAAISQNGCIGKKNALPWYLPEDLKRFKKLTTGHAVLMGRKTWESIPAERRPLPKRTNIVITRQADYPLPEGVLRYASIDDALAAHPDEHLFVIGGADIFTQTLARADTLEITDVHRMVDGDVFFPRIDPAQWKETAREDHPEYSFVAYKRTQHKH